MATGAREQAATCDAFVLSRRLPAPDALPILVRDRKQIAADLSKVFEDRFLFEEGVCRWHMTDEKVTQKIAQYGALYFPTPT